MINSKSQADNHSPIEPQKPIETTSAQLEQNHLLSAVLSTEERKWYDRVKLHILSSKREYYCSWWLRLDYEDVEKDLSTTKINYWLTKLVKKGYLNKKAAKTHTQYSLTEIVA